MKIKLTFNLTLFCLLAACSTQKPIPLSESVAAALPTVPSDETFVVPASQAYDVEIVGIRCGGESNAGLMEQCSGKGLIKIIDKLTKSSIQEIKPEYIRINQQYATSKHPYDLYGIVFKDFNFDGQDDLAVWTDNNAGYGGASYEIYLFDSKKRKFILSQSLSELTLAPYLGLPAIENKHLITYSKSGCCHHETMKYQVIQNKPVLVQRTVEDVLNSTDDLVQVTYTKKGLKWIKKTKKVKAQ